MTRSRRMMAPLTAPLALGLALTLAAAPAQASSTKKRDPRGDALGGTSKTLDLAGVTMRTRGKQRIRITFRLHNPVTVDNLAAPGGMAVEFRRSKSILRSVKVSAVDGKVRSEVCSYDLRKDIPSPTSCRALPLKQIDAKTFRVEVRRKQIKKGAKVLKWHAMAYDASVSPGAIDPLGRGARKPLRWRL